MKNLDNNLDRCQQASEHFDSMMPTHQRWFSPKEVAVIKLPAKEKFLETTDIPCFCSKPNQNKPKLSASNKEKLNPRFRRLFALKYIFEKSKFAVKIIRIVFLVCLHHSMVHFFSEH